MENKLIFADKIGYDLDKPKMRIAARAMLQRLLDLSGYENKQQNSFCLPLVATSGEMGGGGDLGALGIEEFLEAFKTFKFTVDTEEKKAVWSLITEKTEKKEKGEDAQKIHSHFVQISFVDNDEEFLSIGWAKPGKKNLRRQSSTQIAKDKEKKQKKEAQEKQEKKEQETIDKTKKKDDISEKFLAQAHSLAVKNGLTLPEKLAQFDNELRKMLKRFAERIAEIENGTDKVIEKMIANS